MYCNGTSGGLWRCVLVFGFDLNALGQNGTTLAHALSGTWAMITSTAIQVPEGPSYRYPGWQIWFEGGLSLFEGNPASAALPTAARPTTTTNSAFSIAFDMAMSGCGDDRP